MRTLLFLLVTVSCLSACETVQTTSGAEYLSRFDAQSQAAQIDGDIRRAAAIEPLLQFPARFGLARINNGRIVGITAPELKLWSDLAEKHDSLGEFVAISPLLVEFADRKRRKTLSPVGGNPADLVKKIRIGAARQHVDAVLIYGVDASAHRSNTPLAIFDITIIGGAILPTRIIEANATASALLIDVRNGYPYGTATAWAKDEKLSVSWGSSGREKRAGEEIIQAAVVQLVPKIDQMITELVERLKERETEDEG